MKKIIFIFLLANIFLHETLLCQVTIGPEIGISYMPFTLYTANRVVESKRADLIFGINIELPVTNKWEVNSRISYTNRGSVTWVDMLFVPTVDYSEYKHQDLNIDFSFYYKLSDFISIGVGPSIVKKMNSSVSTYYVQKYIDLLGLENHSRIENHMMFEVNSGIKFTKGRYNLNLRYFRRLKNKINFFRLVGKNKVELTVNVMVFGYKKNRR